MKSQSTFRTMLPVLLLLAPFAGAQEDPYDMSIIHQAFPAPAASGPMPAAIQPPTPVSVNRAEMFQEGVNVHELAALANAEIAEVERRTVEEYGSLEAAPPRVGLRRHINPGPLTVRSGSALATDLGEGRKLWTMKVRSPGAYGIRLHFTDFDVGTSSLIVYTHDQQGVLVSEGPYTGKGPERDGDFWVPSLPGAEAFVEVAGEEEPRFTVGEIMHFDRDPHCLNDEDCASPAIGLLPCHLDVNCYLDQISLNAKSATGKMVFMCDATGACSICTGTVINDYDVDTRVPYFITARHCLSTQAEVDTLEVYWEYETDICDEDGGTAPPFPGTLQKSVGGTRVTSYDENDMTFIRLYSVPPGTMYAGWTTATSEGRYGIHHPKGSYKRIVFLDDVGACGAGCWCEDSTDFDYYDRIDGLTQPGSSGSGVFNNSGQLAGQLKGVCSAYHSGEDEMTCSNLSDWYNMYGEFETTYDRIARYLHIGGTMHVDWDPNPFIQDGTPAFPYATVGQAHAAAWEGLRIKIRSGDYPENITLDKEVTLVSDGGVVTIGH